MKRVLPMRWRKVSGGPFSYHTYELWRSDRDEPFVVVQRHTERGRSAESLGWFWYGCGRNTASEPPLDLDAAKAQALAWVKGSPEAAR